MARLIIEVNRDLLLYLENRVIEEELPLAITRGESSSEHGIETLFEYEESFDFNDFLSGSINQFYNLTP